MTSKSKSLIEIIFYALLLISPGVSIAQQQNQLIIALGMMNFDYAEYDTDGTFLDGEKGNIPGVIFELKRPTQSGMLTRFGLDYFNGSVKYDGHLQDLMDPNIDGVPFKTDTDETVTALHATISKPTTTMPNLEIYGKLSYKTWSRNIQGRQASGTGNLGIPYDKQVDDLHEQYTWFQLGVGAEYSTQISESSNANFYLGILQTLNPHMKVFGLTLDQQERTGYEAGFRWLNEVAPGKKLGIGGSILYWEFGRSNTIRVTTPTEIVDITEPYSESTMTTIQFIYQQDLLNRL